MCDVFAAVKFDEFFEVTISGRLATVKTVEPCEEKVEATV
jgi:hypothetical protein